ncbi:MAG: hypothetical protein Kow0069_14980 [Promethearchaeota archaeon]
MNWVLVFLAYCAVLRFVTSHLLKVVNWRNREYSFYVRDVTDAFNIVLGVILLAILSIQAATLDSETKLFAGSVVALYWLLVLFVGFARGMAAYIVFFIEDVVEFLFKISAFVTLRGSGSVAEAQPWISTYMFVTFLCSFVYHAEIESFPPRYLQLGEWSANYTLTVTLTPYRANAYIFFKDGTTYPVHVGVSPLLVNPLFALVLSELVSWWAAVACMVPFVLFVISIDRGVFYEVGPFGVVGLEQLVLRPRMPMLKASLAANAASYATSAAALVVGGSWAFLVASLSTSGLVASAWFWSEHKVTEIAKKKKRKVAKDLAELAREVLMGVNLSERQVKTFLEKLVEFAPEFYKPGPGLHKIERSERIRRARVLLELVRKGRI